MEDISGSELIWLISAGIGFMSVLALLFVLYFQFSRKKILNEQLQQKQLVLDHQKQLNTNAILTQDRERRRIARDLHDDIGAKLNVGLLYIRQLKRSSLPPEKAQEHIAETEDLLLRIMDTNRQISHDLLPPTLETLGTKAAIVELANEVNQSNSAKVMLEWPESVADLPKEKGVHLFRVIQELIKNSLTHGEASTIQVQFIPLESNGFSILYQDNGKGFDPNSVNSDRSPGLGRANIESRLQILGLTIKVQSAPGEGFHAEIV